MLITYKKADGSCVKVRVREVTVAQPVTIGRGKENALKIDDPKSSRVHAAIRFWDDLFVVRDMNSHNGTYLNGQRIEVAKLSPGDVIKIGDTELTAHSEASTSDVTLTV